MKRKESNKNMKSAENWNRRTFLGSVLTTAAVGSVLPWSELRSEHSNIKIADIEVFPVNYPMVGRFKFFEGPQGHMQGRAAVLVRITADDGTTGWGESVPIPKWSYETIETVTTTIRNYLSPELISLNIFDIHTVHEVMDRNIAPSFATGQPMAKAGIDIALHDLAGRVSGQSIPQMWQRKSVDKITLSWTLNPKNLSDLDSLIEEGLQRKYRHFNVKVSPDPEFDVAMCRQLRARVPDCFLWADANGGYDIETALEVAPRLADAGVDVFEQPLPANRISGYRALKKQGALPILMDEGIVSPESLIEFVRLDMLDGVAMKPARCGGLISARRQIEILQDAGLIFLGSGLTDPDVSLAATLALYGAFAYDKPAALNGPQFIDKSILKDPLVVQNGEMLIPEKPGLGIEVDENKIREIQVEI